MRPARHRRHSRARRPAAATGGRNQERPAVADHLHPRADRGGLGFSAQIYDLHDTLLAAASALISRCVCVRGCPACVGPVLENEFARLETKQLTLALLHTLRTGEAPSVTATPFSAPHPEVDFSL
ncbi:MAG: DUF1998 domain-containing protein [Caldilineaceae bacterium]|nr:DUF1998 domain-containing protein [Caldilineaceae bacterium]